MTDQFASKVCRAILALMICGVSAIAAQKGAAEAEPSEPQKAVVIAPPGKVLVSITQTVVDRETFDEQSRMIKSKMVQGTYSITFDEAAFHSDSVIRGSMRLISLTVDCKPILESDYPTEWPTLHFEVDKAGYPTLFARRKVTYHDQEGKATGPDGGQSHVMQALLASLGEFPVEDEQSEIHVHDEGDRPFGITEVQKQPMTLRIRGVDRDEYAPELKVNPIRSISVNTQPGDSGVVLNEAYYESRMYTAFSSFSTEHTQVRMVSAK